MSQAWVTSPGGRALLRYGTSIPEVLGLVSGGRAVGGGGLGPSASRVDDAALPQKRDPLAEELDLPQYGHGVEQVHVLHVARGSEPQQAVFVVAKRRLDAEALRPALPLMIVVFGGLERTPRAPEPLVPSPAAHPTLQARRGVAPAPPRRRRRPRGP